MTPAVPPSVVEALTKYGNQMWLLGSGKPDRALAARADLLAAIADAIEQAQQNGRNDAARDLANMFERHP